MPYIAHAGVKLGTDFIDYNKGEWHFIKKDGNIEHRWRLSDNLIYEAIAGPFNLREDALLCAKQLYTKLLYHLLWTGIPIDKSGCELYETQLYIKDLDGDKETYELNEEYFYWTKQSQGGYIGPGVYEVEKDIDEFSEYKYFDGELEILQKGIDIDFDSIDCASFSYSRESQESLNSIIIADSLLDYGMKMTMYCGILEHLADNIYKDHQVISVIEGLINIVKESDITDGQKDQLISLLNNSKIISASQKCKQISAKYARETYGGVATPTIVGDAYSVRSAFSHGDTIHNYGNSYLIKYVVLDVVKNYMRMKEMDSM